MMIKVIHHVLTLHLCNFLQIFTVDALAFRSASHSHAVTFTIFLQAVAFQAFTLDFYGTSTQEQFLAISAIFALAFSGACLTQLKTLTIIFLASCLGTGALADRLWIRASGGGAIGGLESSLFCYILRWRLRLCGLIVIVE